MDPSAAILATAAGLGFVSAIGLAVYALVLKRDVARAVADKWEAVELQKLSESRELAIATRLVHSEANAKRLNTALTLCRSKKQETYARNAETAAPGAADAVDRILGMHPDADGDAVRAGVDAGRDVPGEGRDLAADAKAVPVRGDRDLT